MQSSNGGWGAFDADNTHHFLNHIPFADHGALLDPPTADVTAPLRVVPGPARPRRGPSPAMARAIDYLRREQEPDGSWFGRWGTNYIYGTWSVLCALNAAGLSHDDPAIRRAVAWLLAKQRAGWRLGRGRGKLRRRAARRVPPQHAVADRLGHARPDGRRRDRPGRRPRRRLARAARSGRTASGTSRPIPRSGFPRVFYLRYHGYRLFFPLLALARFRNLSAATSAGWRSGSEPEAARPSGPRSSRTGLARGRASA